MNIIVNGATKGIGKEVAVCLAADKSNKIIATGRNREVLEDLSKKFNNIHPIVADLKNLDSQAEKVRGEISACCEKIDILINMAGLMIPKNFMDTDGDEARDMMKTNFFGPALMIRLVKPFMSAGSHIVNISSMGGFQGSSKYKGLSFYSASKAAIACLSECLATEFSEDGIIVNCLAIGAVQTEMLAEAFPGYKAPTDAKQMGEFVADFAIRGRKFFNGKIIPVALSNP